MKTVGIAGFRCLIAVAVMTAQLGNGQSTAAPASTIQSLDPGLGITTVSLWYAVVPGAKGTDSADTPTLTVFLPHPGRGNGTAVVVAPGGAYVGLASNLEGRQVADWFTSRGVIAFVLKYRLGAKYPYPIPLQDAQRAIRLVRSYEKTFGISRNRIGIIGFSAGGHLAAMTGTLFDLGNPDASDPVERLSARPDFMVLGYPWLNAMQPNKQNMITYCSVLREIPAEQCKGNEEKYTPSLHVTPQTPPAFIFSTSDDRVVPVTASVEFYSALHAAGVSAELHIFRHGDHGSGLGTGDATLDLWPTLLESWLRDQGWLTPEVAALAAAKAASGAPSR